METLVIDHHQSQYYSRSNTHGVARLRSLGSPSSGDFREINCRTFQSGTGILPTPLKSCTTPVIKRAFSDSFSLTTPSKSVSISEDPKKSLKSSPIPIPTPVPVPVKIRADSDEGFFSDEWSFSELWAGPAYSNSPPPSSLPIPKFSLKSKRATSLDLPSSASCINLDHLFSKSAPPSPTRERNIAGRDLFNCDDSATKTLRRILNLDAADE